jgi:hypothetical protein
MTESIATVAVFWKHDASSEAIRATIDRIGQIAAQHGYDMAGHGGGVDEWSDDYDYTGPSVNADAFTHQVLTELQNDNNPHFETITCCTNVMESDNNTDQDQGTESTDLPET